MARKKADANPHPKGAAMRLNRTQRLAIAHEIRRQLPWAHIIVGARGYNFIEISRGESIRGSYTTGNKIGYGGSAWSRAWPGSYCLHVNLSGPWSECRRHMEPRADETERMIVSGKSMIPPMQKRMRAKDRTKAVADWLVSEAVKLIPEAQPDDTLLRKHERFQTKVNDLEPERRLGC